MICGQKHVFFVGQGIGLAVASEGCLKMKELTYIHCQAVSMANISNDFVTYAKKQPGMPSIFIVLDSGDPREKTVMLEGIAKLKAAAVPINPIIISDCQDEATRSLLFEFCNGKTEQCFFVPQSGPALSPLLCVVPLQRLAYDVTIGLGFNPDKPRNLAKELTTV